ncbi:MAG TPA: peptidoglycan-binding domain-containing protein [Candidatus Acidoferrales bacterium]|nr:peptidoglycan-binding domain-containing protein [Candidatus Acidoferrales bacterium]
MKWLPIAASFALACTLWPGAASSAPARQASSTSGSAASTSGAPKKTKHKHHTRSKPGQKAPTPDRISEIQSALARSGYYQGDPNGKWDSNTVAAVQKFQSANGIEANGKLDAPTLQKLGLGSDIAGVSAPKPVVPGCCLMPPSSPVTTTPPADKPATTCCSTTPQTQSSTSPAGSASTPNSTGTTSASDAKPSQP